jgi:toxin ParE1/3/4
MHVNLTPTLDEYVLAKVKSGRYNNASEVVREALRRMQDEEVRSSGTWDLTPNEIDEVRKNVQQGIEEIERHRDITDIWKYIAQDSINHAVRWRERLHELFVLLAAQPRIGVSTDEIQPDIRRFPFGNYLIYYRITRRGIQIVHVLHGKRDQRRTFEQ